ncbi:MAG: AI-2E family transporter [Methanoregula sp.]|jgi:predicted PurR-regulated permease PerM
MNSMEKQSGIVYPLLVIALIFIIITGVKTTGFIINIILFSLILTLLALPAVDWLRKKGLPHPAAVAVITIIAFLIILALVLMTVYSVQVLVADIPMFQADLNQRMSDLTGVLERFGIQGSELLPSSINLTTIVPVIVSSMLNLTDIVISLFFIAVLTFFALIESPTLARRLQTLFSHKPEMLAQMSRMSQYIMDFIVVRTETNLVHGVLFGGILSIMGVHAAILWGILTFLLGYIPYIGLIIAAVPAIFFAWLQFGIWGAVAVIAVVCVLNLIVENPVFSYLAARKFEMPAIVVLLSVIFWGWLLGMTGMLFAVPITLMLVAVFQCSDDLRWINELLGVSHLFSDQASEKSGDDGQKSP